jgi:two-component system response regulator FixJ
MPDACVHIIDDDETVRRALSFLVGEGGYPTRTFASAEQFLAVADGLAPGCIVTDVKMPGMSGVELVEHLKTQGLGHAIVVMSGYADLGAVVDAMKAGADDFLQKPFTGPDLIKAVHSALEERRPDAVRSSETSAFLVSLTKLTPRQREVFDGILHGQGNKSIARQLGISPRTVEAHRAEIKLRTGYSSSGDLVRMAVLAGLEQG